VVVEKGGDIIPDVVKVITEKRTGDEREFCDGLLNVPSAGVM